MKRFFIFILYLFIYFENKKQICKILPKAVRELEALSCGMLTVRYFLSARGERLTPASVAEELHDASQVCVCGTDEFVKTFREAVPDANKFHAF